MAYEQLRLDNQVCFRLYTAARLITNAYHPMFQDLGITYPQYLVLMVLWEQDNRVISEITEKLQLETNTVTPLLQRMEKQGLIVRTKGMVDSRQRIISLTKEGKAMEEKLKGVPFCMVEKIVDDDFTLKDLQAMAPALDKLIAALEKAMNK